MDDDARFELLGRLFAIMTAEAEDAAAIAADGQTRGAPADRLCKLAVKLHTAGTKITVLADFVIAILSPAAAER